MNSYLLSTFTHTLKQAHNNNLCVWYTHVGCCLYKYVGYTYVCLFLSHPCQYFYDCLYCCRPSRHVCVDVFGVSVFVCTVYTGVNSVRIHTHTLIHLDTHNLADIQHIFVHIEMSKQL